ncbi:MAG: hypothetical protein JO099_09110 [Acidobacteriia bacterium]|nr:hypothetical protein [Terriglobia bacterium]
MEGETDKPEVQELRERQMRNFLLTLMISQGVPMICGGDEIGRTQKGNNNAYAQDNDISWYKWNLGEREKSLLEFTQELVKLRREHPNLHRRKFFQDRTISPATPERQVNGKSEKDVTWLRPDGGEMTEEEWNAGWVRCIGVKLSGRTLDDVNGVGEPIYDDSYLIAFNPHHEPIKFYMPRAEGVAWKVLIDADPRRTDRPVIRSGEPYELTPHSSAVLQELAD